MSNMNGFVIENDVLIKYEGTEAVVIVPEGVTEIGDRAFFECRNITENKRRMQG